MSWGWIGLETFVEVFVCALVFHQSEVAYSTTVLVTVIRPTDRSLRSGTPKQSYVEGGDKKWGFVKLVPDLIAGVASAALSEYHLLYLPVFDLCAFGQCFWRIETWCWLIALESAGIRTLPRAFAAVGRVAAGVLEQSVQCAFFISPLFVTLRTFGSCASCVRSWAMFLFLWTVTFYNHAFPSKNMIRFTLSRMQVLVGVSWILGDDRAQN